MGRIGYFNGEIGNYEDMTIPFSDRSVFYGDAVYDAVLILDRKAFTLEPHLDRLYKSCAMTEIPNPGNYFLASSVCQVFARIVAGKFADRNNVMPVVLAGGILWGTLIDLMPYSTCFGIVFVWTVLSLLTAVIFLLRRSRQKLAAAN